MITLNMHGDEYGSCRPR